MTFITLDIETVGTSRKDVVDYIAKNIKHPATHKKAETIAKWYQEEAPAAIEEAVSRTGLDGAFGQVVCVGLQFDDADPEAVFGLDEKDLLLRLNEKLDFIPRSMHSASTLIGHNVLDFDIRFLWQRYIVNGVRPHPIINTSVNAKAWDNKVFDTMTQFAGFGKHISLDKLCLALGIPSPKCDMDGSMVSKYVADGRLNDVVEYCLQDIVATSACYKRMTFA